MLLQDCVLDALLLVEGQLVGVDHCVERQVANVLERVGRHVEADRPVQDHAPELEQGVERERRHVRLRPTIAALLHVLLELHPPATSAA